MKYKNLESYSKEELIAIVRKGIICKSLSSSLFIRMAINIIAGIAAGAFSLYILSIECPHSTNSVAHVLPVALLVMALFLIQLQFIHQQVDNTKKLNALIELLCRCKIINQANK